MSRSHFQSVFDLKQLRSLTLDGVGEGSFNLYLQRPFWRILEAIGGEGLKWSLTIRPREGW